MIVIAKHPDVSNNEKTFLSSRITAPTEIVPVKSSQGFASGQFIIIGQIASEKTEIKMIDTVDHATSTITLNFAGGYTKTVYDHTIDAPVTVIGYNQVQVERKLTSASSWEVFGTYNIDVDQQYTLIEDIGATATSRYRLRYYNSSTGTVSEWSGDVEAEGYPAGAVATMIDDIRVFVGDKPGDDEIISLLNLAQSTIYDAQDKWYFAKEKELYTTVAATKRYPLPEYFKAREDMYMTDATGTVSKLKYVDYETYKTTYESDTTASDTHAYWTVDESSEEIIIHPIPSAGAIALELTYFAGPTPLQEYTDITKVPSTRPLIFWVVSKIEAAKKNLDQSRLYWNEYGSALQSLSNRRDARVKNFYIKV